MLPLVLIGVLGALPGLLPLARAGEGAEVAAVRRLLRQEDPSDRAAALRRLAGHEGEASLRLLLDHLDDPHPYVRRAAAGVLGAATDEGVRRRLARRLPRLRPARARAAGLRAASLWADEAGRALLLEALDDAEALVRRRALRWLADEPAVGDEVLLARVEGRLEDEDGLVRALAIDLLAERGRHAPAAALLVDPDPRVRLAALESSVAAASLPGSGGAATVAVRRGLDDAVWSVRLAAAELARRLPDATLLPPLVDRLEDERQRVAEAAHAALVGLSGIPFEPEPARWRQWLADGGGLAAGREGRPGGAAGRAEGGAGGHGAEGGRTVAPVRFLELPIRSRHVAFVLDVSGSMKELEADGRTRWTHVLEALEYALDALAETAEGRAFVNVHAFATEVHSAFDAARPLRAGTRARLRRFLAGLAPGGRTALYDGIAAALADPAIDTVVVLSDGVPSAGAYFTKTEILEEVARRNRWRRARIDVVAVGGASIGRRWRGTLERLAEAHGGTCLAR